MKYALIIACILFSFSNAAVAFCKFKAADGSWTYAKSCTPLPEKEITESAALQLKKNASVKDPGPSLEPRRLRGFEYSDTTHSGLRIRLLEPNKAPAANTVTTQ
ncbi:MAG: hypothetical protein E4H01_06680 [Lysobacterales bacterium]|nr:MAG: hypothetical protein E4H01_06680 [Xanthomonadales bacterium]